MRRVGLSTCAIPLFATLSLGWFVREFVPELGLLQRTDHRCVLTYLNLAQDIWVNIRRLEACEGSRLLRRTLAEPFCGTRFSM